MTENKIELKEKERIFEVSGEPLEARCQHCQELYPEMEVGNCAKCLKIICDDDLISDNEDDDREFCPPCLDRVRELRTKEAKEQLKENIDRKIRELQIEVGDIEIENKSAMNCEGKTQIEKYNLISERLTKSQQILNDPQKGLLDLLKEAVGVKKN